MSIRLVLMLFLFSLLYACGGGGSDEPEPQPQPQPQDNPPTANAGSNFAANEQTTVSLQGAASDPEDGSNLTIVWTAVDSAVTLSNADTLNPTFTAPSVLESESSVDLTFELSVTDSDQNTATDTVTVTINFLNDAPVINAIEDQTTNEQESLTLEVMASDPDGSIAEYSWQQLSGISVELEDTSSAALSFVAPTVLLTDGQQQLDFRLTVTDNEGRQSSESVSVFVDPINALPVIELDSSLNSDERAEVALQASVTDTDGTIESFLWQQLEGPNELSLQGTDTDTVSFMAPETLEILTYQLQLTVTDNEGSSSQATVDVSVLPVNDPPVVSLQQNVSGYEGQTIRLTVEVSDPDGNLAENPVVWSQTEGTDLEYLSGDSSSATLVLPALTDAEFITIRATASDVEGLTGFDEVTIDASANEYAINDTGITTCGDYAADNSLSWQNDLSCDITVDADGDPVPLKQDGSSGRDASLNDNADGHAGFSFTKLDSGGNSLPDDASEWQCVRDNVTGLIWEVKTEDGGLHDWRRTYDWYDSNAQTNGGYSGSFYAGDCDGETLTPSCVTETFVNDVNSQSLCGFTDWRLPSREELRSIRSFEQLSGDINIDTNYFPNTQYGPYWTSKTLVGDQYKAWRVHFREFRETGIPKGSSIGTRLVR